MVKLNYMLKKGIGVTIKLTLFIFSLLLFMPKSYALTEVSMEDLVKGIKETDAYIKYSEGNYVENLSELGTLVTEDGYRTNSTVTITFDSSKTSISYTEDTLTISSYVSIQETGTYYKEVAGSANLGTAAESGPYDETISSDVSLKFTLSDGVLSWNYEGSSLEEVIESSSSLEFALGNFKVAMVYAVAGTALELRTDSSIYLILLMEEEYAAKGTEDSYSLTDDLYSVNFVLSTSGLYSTAQMNGYFITSFDIDLFTPATTTTETNSSSTSSTTTDTDSSSSTTTTTDAEEDNSTTTTNDYADEKADNPQTGTKDLYFIGTFITILCILSLSLKIYKKN